MSEEESGWMSSNHFSASLSSISSLDLGIILSVSASEDSGLSIPMTIFPEESLSNKIFESFGGSLEIFFDLASI
jgi:hypothetical protein